MTVLWPAVVLSCVMVALTACGAVPVEPSETDPVKPEPKSEEDGPRPPVSTTPRRDDPPTGLLPELGVPRDIGVYIPSKDELERRLREAREAEAKRLGLPVTTGDVPVVAPVVTPDIVQLPDRGPVEPMRPLNPRLAALMRHLERNDIRSAHKELKGVDADELAPQDRFLLQGLQAYIYFRLGDDTTALDLTRKVVRELEDTMPLKIARARMVRGPLKSIRFGKFMPMAEPRTKLGGTFYLYLEPENVVQVFDGEQWKVSLEVDFTLKDQKGNVVHSLERVSGMAFEKVCNDALSADTNLNRREDLYYAFHVPVPRNLNPMSYTLEIVLRDRNTRPRKEATTSLTLILE